MNLFVCTNFTLNLSRGSIFNVVSLKIHVGLSFLAFGEEIYLNQATNVGRKHYKERHAMKLQSGNEEDHCEGLCRIIPSFLPHLGLPSNQIRHVHHAAGFCRSS